MPRRTYDDVTQGALFDAGDAAYPQPGSLNFDTELRAALSEAIAGSGKSREAIANEMERLLGSDPDYPVSRALIDAWTAPSRSGHRFPAAYLIAFIRVTGASWLLDRIAKRCGRMVVSGEDALRLELLKLESSRKQLERREREIQRVLAGGR